MQDRRECITCLGKVFDCTFMQPKRLSMEGNVFVILNPEERLSRKQVVCLYHVRKEKGQFLVFSINQCTIRMDFDIIVVPNEGVRKPCGMAIAIKDGELHRCIWGCNIVGFSVVNPWHLEEPPSVFPSEIDSFPKILGELIHQCIVQGRKDDPRDFIDMHVVDDRCKIIHGPSWSD